MNSRTVTRGPGPAFCEPRLPTTDLQPNRREEAASPPEPLVELLDELPELLAVTPRRFSGESFVL